MRKVKQGELVVSLAGRDRGTVCLVLREEENFLYLTDGRQHPVEKPKRKKQKHVKGLTDQQNAPIRFEGALVTNRLVRAWLREQLGRIQTTG